jgi:ABC-2 type transport system ATP-binding protein
VSAAALDGVTKRFGAVVALQRVTLNVEHGDVLALLGPNGAGKSTALAVLLGLRRPDSGHAHLPWLGSLPGAVAPAARRGTPGDVVSRDASRSRAGRPRPAHYPAPLTGPEAVERFRRRPRRQAGRRALGRRAPPTRRCACVRRPPRLVVLDEPTAGLDLGARRAVWDAARSTRREEGRSC